jgi:hypothetical protein
MALGKMLPVGSLVPLTHNLEWQCNYQSSINGTAELFVFVDKHDVPQLRDDIISTMFRQKQEWSRILEPNVELAAFVYENLSTTSTFDRYMAYTTAVHWLS